MIHRSMIAAAILAGLLSAALGQDKGSVEPTPLPPVANPNDPHIGARELFGRKILPSKGSTQVIGFYAKGCLAGGQALPLNGPNWQVMRLSRNRNWGAPELVGLLERLSAKVPKVAGWPGILVGDMSQPRGGPMITGHASHQVGLDADIWLTPMPKRELTRTEREEMSATMMVADDRLDIDPNVWTKGHGAVIKAAAENPEVERIFVNAAIKKALCRDAGNDRSWLSKIRPMYGHDYHFHIRIKCPANYPNCTPQPPPPAGSDGCSKKDFAYWFSDAVLHPKPPKVPRKPKPPMTLAQLPPACRTVLNAP